MQDGSAVDFKINKTNIRMNMTKKWKDKCDVCVIGEWVHCDHFTDDVKLEAFKSKQLHPTVPIILVGNVEKKNDLKSLKYADLAGWKVINKTLGDNLAREVGAVKYNEISWKNGRGVKDFIDEIGFAGLGKLEQNKERLENEYCNLI